MSHSRCLRTLLLLSLVLLSSFPVLASAATPTWNLATVKERAIMIGVGTQGGKIPYPESSLIRSESGLGIAANTFTCPRRLGGATFYRQPGGLGLSLMVRGPRHMARVDLDRSGAIIGALKIACRVAASALIHEARPARPR